MDFGSKVKNLFDFKSWMENFVAKTLMTKAVKHGVAAIVGLLSSAIFIGKVKPVLDRFGIAIDPINLAAGLTAAFTGLTGLIMNWAMKVMYKDEERKA